MDTTGSVATSSQVPSKEATAVAAGMDSADTVIAEAEAHLTEATAALVAVVDSVAAAAEAYTTAATDGHDGSGKKIRNRVVVNNWE
jgi:hypothetical protein